MQSIYEMTKDLPAFKSFCRRRSIVKRESWDKTWQRLRKKRASEFKSFCRPKGINSILRDNEFTTGYESEIGGIERATIIKVKGEFICQIRGSSVQMLRDLIAETDRLIARTLEVKAIILEQNEENEKIAA